ncbi:hypothetical protein J2X65_002973 [Ancylobacter sp. 3268]|uniref:hypothetical protein n=1 Tax=Ancylobacter sp. 3268 TaxID=2817752 RepID=UPI002866D1A3|nr:hypothetical protein [Ancylobacter sp. 3268]MDR6953612.1 hypothetical protein [Ancylobacter sp. 3268]
MRRPELSEADGKLMSFLDAQEKVFLHCEDIIKFCNESLDGAHNQILYDVSKVVLKDLVNFSRQFDEFEVEFWNYIFDIDDTKSIIDYKVTTGVFSDHKEYFFSRIERCVSTLNDVITEFGAAGVEWGLLTELEDSLELLFDKTEDLIDIDLSSLKDEDLAELMRMIPPQKAAPIEVISTSKNIKRKELSNYESRISSKNIQQALIALRESILDAVEEANRSNCDPRLIKYLDRCKEEISKDIEFFLPLNLG